MHSTEKEEKTIQGQNKEGKQVCTYTTYVQCKPARSSHTTSYDNNNNKDNKTNGNNSKDNNTTPTHRAESPQPCIAGLFSSVVLISNLVEEEKGVVLDSTVYWAIV